jgi:hypothetical protein
MEETRSLGRGRGAVAPGRIWIWTGPRVRPAVARWRRVARRRSISRPVVARWRRVARRRSISRPAVARWRRVARRPGVVRRRTVRPGSARWPIGRRARRMARRQRGRGRLGRSGRRAPGRAGVRCRPVPLSAPGRRPWTGVERRSGAVLGLRLALGHGRRPRSVDGPGGEPVAPVLSLGCLGDRRTRRLLPDFGRRWRRGRLGASGRVTRGAVWRLIDRHPGACSSVLVSTVSGRPRTRPELSHPSAEARRCPRN